MPAARHIRSRPRRSWPQRLLLALGATLSLVAMVAAAGAAYGAWRFGQLERTDLDLADAASGEPENFLIVGSDSRKGFDDDAPDAAGIVGDGVGGRRADTIVIARIDPGETEVDLLSLPRDLWLPIAGADHAAKINAAYGEGEQVLADTITDAFDIEVNHYVEVDFRGFARLVEAIDGVPLYFDTAMRDANSGLVVPDDGCHVLDGDEALAFVRARSLQYRDDDGDWRTDGTGDLGRISRQQIFLSQATERALDEGLGDPATLNRLVDVGLDNVTVDDALDGSDLLGLGQRFADFDAAGLDTHSLPVEPYEAPNGSDALRLVEAEAQRTLNVFRGLPPDTVSEAMWEVRVLNGTGVDGQASDVADALEGAGFATAGEPGNAGEIGPASLVETEVRHGPGAVPGADLVARHLTSGADVVSDPDLDEGEVVLITGADFELVTTEAAPPTDTSTTTSSSVPEAERRARYADADGDRTDVSAATSDEPVAAAAPTTTEPPAIGVTPEAPPGVDCG